VIQVIAMGFLFLGMKVGMNRKGFKPIFKGFSDQLEVNVQNNDFSAKFQ
jgi:hypothetical protein